MNHKYLRAFFPLLALAALVIVAPACVQQRPARNGVFNENQYVRKDFLIHDQNGATDPGWMLKSTVTRVTTPDPLGDSFNIFAGAENGGALVRFAVTQDKLQLINQREIANVASPARMPEVMNAWPVTNIDLKYRVNLDGEVTNFYEENQELDWQVRQWVKINFAKNDMSDVSPLGTYTSSLLANCTDTANSSATLEPGSFLVDEANDYMQWTVQVTVPLRFDDATCVNAYGMLGYEFAQIGRQNVTFDLMYSFMRANPTPTKDYTPLQVAEKDPIRHKYGPIELITWDRDPGTGTLAAAQWVMRFNPNKPIVWYFAEGFPENYKSVFTGAGGIKDQTNKMFASVGAKATVDFKNFDEGLAEGQAPRQYGDVRYSFLRWVSDEDMQSFWAGVTQFVGDPRTGETLSSSISFNDFAIKDYYIQRIDAYLQMVGASPTDYSCPKTNPNCSPPAGDVGIGVNAKGEWLNPGACKDGDVMPIVPATAAASHNGNSSLFQKMQTYLQKPSNQYGNLGPQDFITSHTIQGPSGPQPDTNFYDGFYGLAPYYIFADPAMNPFVIPEGGAGVLGPDSIWKMMQNEAAFQQAAAQIDQGQEPYDGVTGQYGLTNALNFLNNFRDLTTAHKNYVLAKNFIHGSMKLDSPDAFSLETVMAKDARHCILQPAGKNPYGGKAYDGTTYDWETKEQWQKDLIDTYWSQVFWHEFGHSLGMEHNFMASVDGRNFPTYKDAQGKQHYSLYASSVMEYNSAPDRVFWHAGWAPYDTAAIGWMYSNNTPTTGKTCDPTNTAAGMTVNGGCSTATNAMGLNIEACDSGTLKCIGTAISGQVSPGAPWNDKFGYGSWSFSNGDWVAQNATAETQYLYCNEHHLAYTPFCRQGDLGVTPSEIVANQIDSYEWQYQWRNYRLYRKIWDDSAYANGPAGVITDMRRFLSLWAFDWSASELADSLRRIGIKNPNPNSSDLEFYTSLTNKFNADISAANQLVGAFHESIIQQSSGERPYATVYDKYYGDVTQQGIILDKLFAMQGWVGLWPTDNYDRNQAGFYISSWATVGDASYSYVGQNAVVSMIGGQYNVYPYFVPLAVAQFAQDTHNVAFSGNDDVRNWIGGKVFDSGDPLTDFLTYFRNIAVLNSFQDPTPGSDCSKLQTCLFDPRAVSDQHNEFFGPDKRQWIWAYIPDRNTYIAVEKETNTATYLIARNYNDYYVYQLDDGSFPGGVFGAELPMKYYLDSFKQFN